MANLDKQYNSFLGGEVSQRLWHRADMDKFGKWFSDASNIRFRETGSFYNRKGFEHAAHTKNNNPNDHVKLLSFSFNDEQSYLVELGSSVGVGYARFFQNGQPILSDGVPYEIESPFSNLEGQTLKYTQSGDILFITNAKYGIWELRRLKADGTQWEFKKFGSDVMPMGDLEGQDGDYLSAETTVISQSGTFTITFPEDQSLSTIQKPELLLNGTSFWSSSSSFSLSSLANQLTTQLTAKAVTVTASNTARSLTFSCSDWTTANITSIAINYGESSSEFTRSYTIGTSRPYTIDLSNVTGISKIILLSGSTIATEVWMSKGKNYTWSKLENEEYNETYTLPYNVERGINIPADSSYSENKQEAATVLNDMLSSINELPYVFGTKTFASGETTRWQNHNGQLGNAELDSDGNIVVRLHPNAKWWQDETIPNGTDSASSKMSIQAAFMNYRSYFTEKASAVFNFELKGYTSYRRTAEAVKQTENQNGYLFHCHPNTNKFFGNLHPGDTFTVKNHMEAETINATFNNSSSASDSIKGTGDYRYYTSGNWVGTVVVQFSLDKGTTWRDLHVIRSNSESAPGNDNTSGSIEADDLIYFRAVPNITSGAVAFVMETAAYDVWSYYRVYADVSDTDAYAIALKNDIGEITHEEEFKKNAFSDTLGYPDCIGFYQNRLFFGKTYMIYASAVSDFWNFYQRAENLQDDDAINMSLLSYKVNNIKNIVTDKAFFAFTGGGEFGIGSEGALTQADKFLKQFSSHGSTDVAPVLTGDLVIFVDKTGNTTRALQYSLETDNYEATDVSIFLREKLESRKIVKTDFSYKNKEAYFLTEDGLIFVMKYLPEQNILAWSHLSHAAGTIKDICIVPKGASDDLFILVSHGSNMCIEFLSDNWYFDSCTSMQNSTPVSSISTHFVKGETVGIIADGYRWYELTVGDGGAVTLPQALTNIVYGLPYASEATLLTPTHQQQDASFSTYFLQRPFKVRFICYESYGFKVGEATEEKFQVEWQAPEEAFDEEQELTTGFKSVSIVSKFGYDKKITFVQQLPYPMDIQNVFIESDFGGK